MPGPSVTHGVAHLEREPCPSTPSRSRRPWQPAVARTTRPRRATASAVPGSACSRAVA